MKHFLRGKSNCLFHRYDKPPVFTLTSQIMRRTIEYQYSCQYSYEYLSTCPWVRVQVWVLLVWNLRVRVQYEYQKFSTRVLRVRVPSTSTPALFKRGFINLEFEKGRLYTWRRHQMKTFSALLAFCAGNSPVTGGFPLHKGQWRRALMFSLICAWTNSWANNGDASSLRCHHTHYDVIVMK